MQGDSPARTGRDAFDEKKCRLARESGRAPFVPEEVSRDATITANEGATEKGWRPAAPGVDAGGAPTTPAAAAFVAAFPAPPIDAGHARGVIASQTAGEPEEGPTTDVRLIRLDSVNTIPKSWYQASGNMGLLIDDVVYVAVFFLDREERITGLDLFFSSSAGLTITDCGRLGCTSHSRKRIVRIFGLLLQAYGANAHARARSPKNNFFSERWCADMETVGAVGRRIPHRVLERAPLCQPLCGGLRVPRGPDDDGPPARSPGAIIF